MSIQKKILFFSVCIIAFLALGLFGCNNKITQTNNESQTNEKSQLQNEITSLQNQQKILQVQKTQLQDEKKQLQDDIDNLQKEKDQLLQEMPSTGSAFLSQGITFDFFKKELVKHLELIPFKGVLGGTPYYDEESIIILDFRNVYVSAEDGHIGASMFLQYEIDDNKTIKFKLVAYDEGNGLKLKTS